MSLNGVTVNLESGIGRVFLGVNDNLGKCSFFGGERGEV